MPKTYKARIALILFSVLGASATTAAREDSGGARCAPGAPGCGAADPALATIGGHGVAPPTRCLRA